MTIQSVNPATGQVLAHHEEMAPDAARAAVDRAHEAFLVWRQTSLGVRAATMRRAAEWLRRNEDPYARLMALKMGKPVRDGLAEVQKCARTCAYFAQHADRLLEREVIETEARTSYVTFQPLGVVLGVMPWNFPFWQVFRFAAPTLMAGNAAVIKHASNVPGCALAIEEVFRQAGFPQDLFRTLLIGNGQVGALIEHPAVKAVTLTGSASAGRAVARAAGGMLKKTVLELGGSDPYLVLHDADLDFAAALCAKARLRNSGQSCVAAKRFIVVEAVRQEFELAFVARMADARMGDPLREDTGIGPLARHDLRDALHRQVETSIAQGARCLLGGTIPEGPGAYYPPTVLSDVRQGMAAYREELFGPVAAIIPVKDEETAIATANDSVFGLGGCVLTRDVARGEHIAAAMIESGCVFVNKAVRSDPRLPFGGIKESGYGRELSGYGIKEFVNIKTVYVA